MLFGLIWMDPLMGIIGAVLVTRWSWGLLRQTSQVLLDYQAPIQIRDTVRSAIESVFDNRVADLHVWSIGPGIYAAIVALVTDDPRSAEFYQNLIPKNLGIVHVSVEVYSCSGSPGHRRAA
jgi:Co/Zn/Cd efflux system component